MSKDQSDGVNLQSQRADSLKNTNSRSLTALHAETSKQGPWGLLDFSVPCPAVIKHSCIGPDFFGDRGGEVVYSRG